MAFSEENTMLVDSHAHLNDPKFNGDLEAVLDRARAAGVETIIVPGSDVKSSERGLELAAVNEGLYAAAGIHPHEAGKASEVDFDAIEKLVRAGDAAAVGEIGLDYHYDLSPRDVQRDVFRRQLELAATANMPVIVHSRESNDDVLAGLAAAVARHPEWKAGDDSGRVLRGVLHSFSGSIDEALKAIELGFLISIPGWITFKRSPVTEIVNALPLQHLLIETDSPYLAPVPHRGKRNEPAFLLHTAEAIATLKHLPVEEVARVTTENAEKLFKIGR